MSDAESRSQEEIREDAARGEDDPTTEREELEQDLMEADASEAGAEIGDEMD